MRWSVGIRVLESDGVSLDLIKDTVPHHRRSTGASTLCLTPAIDAVGCVGDRSKPSNGNRFTADITIAINSATMPGDGVVDRFEFPAFCFDQLTVEFVLNCIGSGV